MDQTQDLLTIVVIAVVVLPFGLLGVLTVIGSIIQVVEWVRSLKPGGR